MDIKKLNNLLESFLNESLEDNESMVKRKNIKLTPGTYEVTLMFRGEETINDYFEIDYNSEGVEDVGSFSWCSDVLTEDSEGFKDIKLAFMDYENTCKLWGYKIIDIDKVIN